MPQVKFRNCPESYNVRVGTELKRLCELNPHIPIKFGCRQGQCGTCAIHVSEGSENLSPKTKQETETLFKLKLENKRLACQCAVMGNLTIDI